MWAAVRPTRGDDFGKFVTPSVPTCVYSTMWAAVRPTGGDDLGKSVTPSVPTSVYNTMWAAVRPTEGDDLGKFVTLSARACGGPPSGPHRVTTSASLSH